MKNTGIKIFISLLIIGIVSFYYATMDFDARLIADQLYGYSNSSKDIEYSCNLKDDDIYSEDYYNAIVAAAVNNGLDIGQIDIDPYLGIYAEYYRYYLPNDYYDGILLANNEYVDTSSKKSYATDSNDPELRIFTMSGINPQVLEPLSYESFDPSRSFYLLPVSDNTDIESFKDELFALYPDSLNIETFETTISSGYIDFNDFLFTNQYYIYIAFLALFFGIVANSSILKDTDNISKEKLEGYGSLELLWRYSLKHIVISHILLIAGYIVAFKMLYPISIFKVEYFWLQLIKYNLVSLSILSLIALIYFAEIWFTPINLNIKGKNHIKEIISLLFSLKLFILVVSSLTFIAYFTNAVTVLNYASLKNGKLEQYRDVYQYSYNTIDDFGKDRFDYETYDRLREYFNTFAKAKEISGLVHNLNSGDIIGESPYYDINDEFVLTYFDDTLPDVLTIYLKKGYQISDLQQKQFEQFGEYEIAYYENSLEKVYQWDDLLFDSYLYVDDSLPFIYVPNYPDFKQLTMFTYPNSNKEEVQQLYTEIAHECGYDLNITMYSMEESYTVQYDSAIKAIIPQIIYILIYAIMILSLSIQVSYLDGEVNERYYFLEYIEGERFGRILTLLAADMVVYGIALGIVIFRNGLAGIYPLVILMILDISILVVKHLHYKRKLRG